MKNNSNLIVIDSLGSYAKPIHISRKQKKKIKKEVKRIKKVFDNSYKGLTKNFYVCEWWPDGVIYY